MINVDASDSDGTISEVEFYSGQTLLGTDATAPYSQEWTNAAGSYTLTAKVIDDAGAATASEAVAIRR